MRPTVAPVAAAPRCRGRPAEGPAERGCEVAQRHERRRPDHGGTARSDTAQRETTAIYAHRNACAMGYRAEPPPLPAETEDVADGREADRSNASDRSVLPTDPLDPPTNAISGRRRDWMDTVSGAGEPAQRQDVWLGGDPLKPPTMPQSLPVAGGHRLVGQRPR